MPRSPETIEKGFRLNWATRPALRHSAIWLPFATGNYPSWYKDALFLWEIAPPEFRSIDFKFVCVEQDQELAERVIHGFRIVLRIKADDRPFIGITHR